MQLQQEISARKLAQRIGRQMTVLVESAGTDGYLARSYGDAPEIDGLVHIETGDSLPLGGFSRVQITGADEYDLYARPCR